jgi:hypothetical protein
MYAAGYTATASLHVRQTTLSCDLYYKTRFHGTAFTSTSLPRCTLQHDSQRQEQYAERLHLLPEDCPVAAMHVLRQSTNRARPCPQGDLSHRRFLTTRSRLPRSYSRSRPHFPNGVEKAGRVHVHIDCTPAPFDGARLAFVRNASPHRPLRNDPLDAGTPSRCSGETLEHSIWL